MSYFFIFYLIIKYIVCEYEENFQMAKASACMVISKSDIELNSIKNQKEIFEGLVNCYFKISEIQLMNLIELIKNGITNFKDTEFNGLAIGTNFLKNFPNKDDRKRKMKEFQMILITLKNSEQNKMNFNIKENSKNSFRGVKLILLKILFFIMNYVNGYVIIIISIILGFIILRKISLNYSNKSHKNIKKKIKTIYIFLINFNYFFTNIIFND